MKTCKYCKKEVEKLNRGYCSNTCKNFDKDLKRQNELTGIEGGDYIVNLWSGLKCLQINSQYIKGRWPGKTIEDYKKEFPDAPLQCGNMIKKATKNSGKHMKEEKYRKMFSENFKGENNPNHKSKTTLEERKSRSPFSKSFYLKDNPNLTDAELEQKVGEFVTTALKDRLSPNQKEYWINKGFTEDEAIELVKERQRTFTLEKCIEKYGKIKGLKVFENRQKKWLKSLHENFEKYGDGRSPQSKLASDLITDICDILNIEIPKKEKWISDGNKAFSYDFTYDKKIIEFNGDYWHCNPKFFKPDFYHTTKKKTASELWSYDKYKVKLANKYGYEVLVIWENECNNDRNKVLEKCIDFLTK